MLSSPAPRPGLKLLPLPADAVDGGGERMNSLQQQQQQCQRSLG
jgi:hypothetical protein